MDSTGAVLDGTPFPEAIAKIDEGVSRIPAGYFVNCVHPKVLFDGLSRFEPQHKSLRRFIGFQGNTSRQDPRIFDTLATLESESPESFAEASIALADKYSLKILGGCCGTGPEHIEAIGKYRVESVC